MNEVTLNYEQAERRMLDNLSLELIDSLMKQVAEARTTLAFTQRDLNEAKGIIAELEASKPTETKDESDDD